ncbi:MAG: translation initiation factor IF-3, partial [Patescibacteria group bacterium]|nr:translation initiation factor IF-3 [Patescibacteria group bacterium]
NTDLIEIAPKANPPVAKLIAFDKYRYQKEKELKKQRLAQKSAEMKQIWIGPKTAQNDLMVKARQIEKFMEEGSAVEIRMRLRGREKGNKEWARQKLAEFLKMITLQYKVLNEEKKKSQDLQIQIRKS